MRFCLLHGQAGDAFELGRLGGLSLLQLVLQPPEVTLAVCQALVLACQVDELPLDLLFLREDALLDLEHRFPPVGELRVDLRAQLDGLLPGLDLRLTAQRLRLALGVLHQLAPDAPRLADPGRAEDLNRKQRECDPCGDSDGDSDTDRPVPPKSLSFPRARTRAPQKPALACRGPPSSAGGKRCRQNSCHTISEFGKAQFAGKCRVECTFDRSAVSLRPQIRLGLRRSNGRSPSRRANGRSWPWRHARRAASGHAPARDRGLRAPL